MELRLNVVFLTLMALAVLGMTSTNPSAALDARVLDVRDLARLEDAHARSPGELGPLVRLLSAYLDAGRYDLALSTATRARAPLRAEAEVLHRWSRAEEGLTHYPAARSIAARAVAACDAVAPCPRHRRTIFAMHLAALDEVVRVDDPDETHVAAAYASVLRTTAVPAAK